MATLPSVRIPTIVELTLQVSEIKVPFFNSLTLTTTYKMTKKKKRGYAMRHKQNSKINQQILGIIAIKKRPKGKLDNDAPNLNNNKISTHVNSSKSVESSNPSNLNDNSANVNPTTKVFHWYTFLWLTLLMLFTNLDLVHEFSLRGGDVMSVFINKHTTFFGLGVNIGLIVMALTDYFLEIKKLPKLLLFLSIVGIIIYVLILFQCHEYKFNNNDLSKYKFPFSSINLSVWMYLTNLVVLYILRFNSIRPIVLKSVKEL